MITNYEIKVSADLDTKIETIEMLMVDAHLYFIEIFLPTR